MISRDDIRRCYDTIRPYIRRTPVIQVDLSELDESAAALPAGTLKLEYMQCGGAFKARGAFTNLLLREVPPVGVVAASGGNHGVAVAYAAHRLGVPAKIFVPTVSAPAKIERIRQLGADLVVTGERYADALTAAQDWERSSGAMSVHAYDQRETILGQGTLGLELAEQVADLDTVLVPVGGGGLISGVAAWFAGDVRVIGVEPEGAPTLSYARAEGGPSTPLRAASRPTPWPRGRSASWCSPSPRPMWTTWCWSATCRSWPRSGPCGRRSGSPPSRPPRSGSRPCWRARTSPRPASTSRW